MKNKFLGIDSRLNKIEILDKHISENGYLVLKCKFARTGIQERYGAEISPDFEQTKLYKEYRSPDVVFKPEVLTAFKNIVITNEHPDEVLNTTNTTDHAIGFVSSEITIINQSYLECTITIYDAQTIEDIQAGKVELSAGYLYSIELVDDPNYDYIQKDIKPNHIAIVKAGRCGSGCSIAFDIDPNQKKGEKVKVTFNRMLPNGTKEVVSEIEIENEDQAKELQKVADTLCEATKPITASDEEIEAQKKKDQKALDLEEENSKLKAEIDTNKNQQIGADSAVVKTLAKDMAGVLNIAEKMGIDTAGKKICDVKKEIITKQNPKLDLAGKDETYIKYAFDNVATQIKDSDNSYFKGMDIVPTKDLDENTKIANDAKEKFNERFGGNQ